ILSQSDDPTNDAKKLGLDYKNGKTTIAIQLTDDNQKVLRQLSSISNIDVKNDNNVQITINLKDLPKLRTITGIENVRPPFPAVQFEESVSEGVYFMNADLAQYAGITGKDVKVAVFDLSFTNNPKISDNIVEVKSFRPNISVFPEHWNGDEALHGTAVAEIITDVAPDVELFLYAMESDIEFAAAVDEAISKNIDIIAMSAGWPNFPTDGTSPITKKIEEAVENGIVFVVPAGNFGNKHWEGNFADSNLNNWHDFSKTDEGLSIKITEERIAEEKPIIAHMMWDVGLNDVADFDLVLVDPLGQIVDFSANKQVTSEDTPFEYIHHIPDIDGIYSLGVLYAGDMTSPKNRPQGALEIFTVNDELEYPVIQSSVSVPADAHGAIVVGAVNHLDGIIEPYSSQGPTNNGKLAPHVVGPDGVTTLALDGKPFFGTSATTPYVAGLAALILENNPGTSPEQLLTLIQQNADRALFSLQNEYDYALGYGTASAGFLIENSEAMQ
ncbi:MAG TPA: S8 family serine peptidase, partial [Nitrososphaeraceae archaeon]